jgi:VanZ family protein
VSSASRRRIAFRTVRTVGVIAASIEALQYLLALGRIASVTDVLSPIAGAALAVLLTELCAGHAMSHLPAGVGRQTVKS